MPMLFSTTMGKGSVDWGARNWRRQAVPSCVRPSVGVSSDRRLTGLGAHADHLAGTKESPKEQKNTFSELSLSVWGCMVDTCCRRAHNLDVI